MQDLMNEHQQTLDTLKDEKPAAGEAVALAENAMVVTGEAKGSEQKEAEQKAALKLLDTFKK